MISAMAAPSFMPIPPRNWPMSGPACDSWNRIPPAGKARAGCLAGSSGIRFCLMGRGRLAGSLLLVTAAAQHGGHQAENVIPDVAVGIRQRRCGALLFGLVAQDGDEVSLRSALLR